MYVIGKERQQTNDKEERATPDAKGFSDVQIIVEGVQNIFECFVEVEVGLSEVHRIKTIVFSN